MLREHAATRALPLERAIGEPPNISAGLAPKPAVEPADPTISGPESYERGNDQPPSFAVWPGLNAYFAVELASDPALFSANAAANRNARNFFGSWQRGLINATGATIYVLPKDAWISLRDAERLYFRLVTSSSAAGWADVARSDGNPGVVALKGHFTHSASVVYRSEEDLWRSGPRP